MKKLSTRFVSEEEREAKYNRVLSSSILALGHLIQVTSDKEDADMQELYLNVLRQNKFWKYARHKSPNVGVQLISPFTWSTYKHYSIPSSNRSKLFSDLKKCH